MFLSVISILFLLLYAFLIGYYFKWWKAAEEYEEEENNELTSISVIVPARNEAKTIKNLLTSLSLQDYPAHLFEIIVVDDFSTDETKVIAESFGLRNLRCIHPDVDAALSSKKKAIEAGIKNANGELIITTDADCTAQPGWFQTMNCFYLEKKARFIAAPVRFTHNNSFLQVFQSLDFITLQGITAASVSANFHTMCNGANLAYTKQAFAAVNGFEGIDKVATGDDMLLMHKIWKKYPDQVFYLKNKAAIVSTPPMQSWKAFISQRKRWASKTLVYDDYRIIAVLGFVYLLNLLFFVLLGAAIVNPAHWLDVVLFWVLKTIIELPFVYSVAKFYNEQRLLKYFFFFQPLHMFYTVWVGMISQFGKYEWKGRKTK